MKTVVYRNYGSPDVLISEEIERPSPGDDEVLIRAELRYRSWKTRRARLAGIVTGTDVKTLRCVSKLSNA